MKIYLVVGLFLLAATSVTAYEAFCGPDYYAVATFNRSGAPIGYSHPEYNVRINNFTETTTLNYGQPWKDFFTYRFSWDSDKEVAKIVADVFTVDEMGYLGFSGHYQVPYAGTPGSNGNVDLDVYDTGGGEDLWWVNNFAFCVPIELHDASGVCGYGEQKVAAFNRSGSPIGYNHPTYDVQVTNWTEALTEEPSLYTTTFEWRSEQPISRIMANVDGADEQYLGSGSFYEISSYGTAGSVRIDEWIEDSYLDAWHTNNVTFCAPSYDNGGGGGGEPVGVPEFGTAGLVAAVIVSALGLALLRRQSD